MLPIHRLLSLAAHPYGADLQKLPCYTLLNAFVVAVGAQALQTDFAAIIQRIPMLNVRCIDLIRGIAEVSFRLRTDSASVRAVPERVQATVPACVGRRGAEGV